jgi:hypothetical protein
MLGDVVDRRPLTTVAVQFKVDGAGGKASASGGATRKKLWACLRGRYDPTRNARIAA